MATSSRFIVVVFAPDNPFCDGRWEVCPCRRRLTGGGCKDGPALQLGGTLPTGPAAPKILSGLSQLDPQAQRMEGALDDNFRTHESTVDARADSAPTTLPLAFSSSSGSPGPGI